MLQLVAVKEKSEFSFHGFPLKKEAKNRQWQVAVGRCDAATSKLWEAKHHDLLCSKHFEKKCFTDRTLLSIQFGLKYSAQLKDEAVPTLFAQNKKRPEQTWPERGALAKWRRKRDLVGASLARRTNLVCGHIPIKPSPSQPV